MGAVSLFFMIQIDVWCPWVSRVGVARFQSISLLFWWKKRKDSGPSSEATQVIFSFLTIPFHGSSVYFSSALTWWFWHFSYTLHLVFLLIEKLHCLLVIVWGFSWFCNLVADPKYPWKNSEFSHNLLQKFLQSVPTCQLSLSKNFLVPVSPPCSEIVLC